MIEAEKEYRNFEKDVVTLIKSTIKRLGRPYAKQLKVIPNYKFRTIDRQNHIVDIFITNNEQPIVVISVKYFISEIDSGLINREFQKLHKQSETLRAPYYVIISNKGYQLGNRQKPSSRNKKFYETNDLLRIISEIKNRCILQYLNEIQINQSKSLLEQFNEHFKAAISIFLKGTTKKNLSTKDALFGFISKLNNDCLVADLTNIYLNNESETLFFKTLLGNCQNQLFRYTSLPSFFRSCNEKRQGMASIVCMNDRSEIYYFSKFIHDELSYNNFYNQAYLLSFTTKSDDLTMFRLYGDDCAGVCIEYQIDLLPADLEKLNFYLAPVSYGKQKGKHPELDFIKGLLKFSHNGRSFRFRQLDYWQYFFKHYDYRDEAEIRLLYLKPDHEQDLTSHDEKKDSQISEEWILDGNYGIVSPITFFDITDGSKVFPLTIKEVILGSKLKESKLNREQILELMEKKNIKRIPDFVVTDSKIDHYR